MLLVKLKQHNYDKCQNKKNAKKILIELLEFDFITIEDIKELLNKYPIEKPINKSPQIKNNIVIKGDSFSPSNFLTVPSNIPKFKPKEKKVKKT